MTTRTSSLLGRAQRLTRRYLRKVPLDIYRRKPAHHYVPNYYGRSAHKQEDLREMPGFGTLAATVIAQKRTLLYYDRLFTIYEALLNLSRRFGKQSLNLSEVGVFRGGTSYFIASALRELKLAGRLYCFDTFEGHSATDLRGGIDDLSVHTAHTFSATEYSGVVEYLKEFPNVEVYKGRVQETSGVIEAKRFHFVHLDVDIYEPTAYGLRFFDERLEVGGIIVVDDYGFVTCEGARRAVNEFLEQQPGYFGFPLLTGQFMLVKNQEG